MCVPAWLASLASFQEVKESLEDVSPLQEYLDRVVLNNIIDQLVDSDHDRSEIAELELNRKVE